MSTDESTPDEPHLEGKSALDERKYMFWALSLGYNELAKLGRTLGEKMFFRLLRDAATDRLIADGGNRGQSPFANEPSVVEIHVDGDRMPWIKLLARDVELMRAYVAEHDERVRTSEPSGNSKEGKTP